MKDIYQSANLGQVRKIIDKFQNEQYEKIESEIPDNEMPMEETIFKEMIIDFERSAKEGMSGEEFKVLEF